MERIEAAVIEELSYSQQLIVLCTPKCSCSRLMGSTRELHSSGTAKNAASGIGINANHSSTDPYLARRT